MARRVPPVGEGPARDRHELPVVTRGPQRQLDDSVVDVATHFAVRDRIPGPTVQRVAAGADDELSDAVDIVEGSGRRLRSKALVIMVVTVHHHVGAVVVQRLPDRLRRQGAAVPARAEPRVVPVGQRAGRRMRRQIGAQPALLRRARAHVDVGIDHHDVPRAQGVAVVADARIARRRAPVRVVARRARGRPVVVLVVPGRRARARLVPAPGRIEAVHVIRQRPVWVGTVTERGDLADDTVEHSGRSFLAGARAVRDIARTSEYRGTRRALHRDGRRANHAFTRRPDGGRACGQSHDEAAAVHGRYRRRTAPPGHGPPGQRVAVGVPRCGGELSRSVRRDRR